MKVLAVSDEESKYLWDYYRPGRLSGIDLILSAGDLKSNYLSFLVTMANHPVLYVHGNHDTNYAAKPPEGCECIDDRLVKVNGLRILGLGGSRKYSGGPHQYTEKEMRKRIRKLRFALFLAGGVDIVLTHAPVAGYGDAEDPAHQGFEAFKELLDKYHPQYLIHGHVHKCYGHEFVREREYGSTKLINCCERFTFEL